MNHSHPYQLRVQNLANRVYQLHYLKIIHLPLQKSLKQRIPVDRVKNSPVSLRMERNFIPPFQDNISIQGDRWHS
jgi:hypothetical protein